jgi:hypothetical protein
MMLTRSRLVSPLHLEAPEDRSLPSSTSLAHSLTRGNALPAEDKLDLPVLCSEAHSRHGSFSTAGTPFQVKVVALDPLGNRATNFAGKVHFTSSDLLAGLPTVAELHGWAEATARDMATDEIQAEFLASEEYVQRGQHV